MKRFIFWTVFLIVSLWVAFELFMGYIRIDIMKNKYENNYERPSYWIFIQNKNDFNKIIDFVVLNNIVYVNRPNFWEHIDIKIEWWVVFDCQNNECDSFEKLFNKLVLSNIEKLKNLGFLSNFTESNSEIYSIDPSSLSNVTYIDTYLYSSNGWNFEDKDSWKIAFEDGDYTIIILDENWILTRLLRKLK